jgi:hypothetical protein
MAAWKISIYYLLYIYHQVLCWAVPRFYRLLANLVHVYVRKNSLFLHIFTHIVPWVLYEASKWEMLILKGNQLPLDAGSGKQGSFIDWEQN